MMNPTQRMLSLVLGSAVLLSACGGGGGGPEEAAPLATGSDVPVAATQSAAAATSFVRTVASDENGNGEGLRVDAIELATSETDEPEPDR
jgi:hypothetical protein